MSATPLTNSSAVACSHIDDTPSSPIPPDVPFQGTDVSQDDIEEAAKAAMAHGFVKELQDGYDTAVGESSNVQLSGALSVMTILPSAVAGKVLHCSQSQALGLQC